jgi:hypothetical protein
MPLAYRRRDPVDRLAVADVADLELAADLLRERAQPLLAPREQDTPPAARRERARSCGADSARRPGDDGDGRPGRSYLPQTRTARVADAVRPAASRSTALSSCFPVARPFVFHWVENSPAEPRRCVETFVESA